MVPTCGCRVARPALRRVAASRSRFPAAWPARASSSGRSSYPSARCRGQHERAGAGRDKAVQVEVDLRQRIVARVVQHDRNEAPDRSQLVRSKGYGLLGRVGREKGVRTEFCRGTPRRASA